jgi:nucleoside-diphosphate-sugar epimerase
VRLFISGGAGYIGSLLSAQALRDGHEVVVLDDLLFGGDSILPLMTHPRFRFHKGDVVTTDLGPLVDGVDAVVHLAAIVGYPACHAIGEERARRINTEATARAFDASAAAGAARFLFASTYSNYGIARDDRPVNEDSPLFPQSIYAQTKIAAEQLLMERARTSRCAPIIPRFATLFGVSPRTRFDLLINQFVLEALTLRKLVIFQGDYTRAFVHVRDVVRALWMMMAAPMETVRGEIFNVGSEAMNFTKRQIVDLVCEAVPGTQIEIRDVSFGGDMRDVALDCTKIRRTLGFVPEIGIRDGIAEVRDAIVQRLIAEPQSPRYRNHIPIVL